MTYLLRDIMERAATVDEALEILKTAKRTCEYYYVISDKKRNLAAVRCTPGEMIVLQPGQQHELLPPVPEDTVFVSGGDRAKELSKRLHEQAGKIDADAMTKIIKRPVAMGSNLHNAIFMPETLELWFADAGKRTPACDEPYARVKVGELIEFYRKNIAAPQEQKAAQ
jgi:fumarylacetoacetate (FAA) hydrolase family protein